MTATEFGAAEIARTTMPPAAFRQAFVVAFPDWRECTGNETACQCAFHSSRRERRHFAEAVMGRPDRARDIASGRWMLEQVQRVQAAGMDAEEWARAALEEIEG